MTGELLENVESDPHFAHKCDDQIEICMCFVYNHDENYDGCAWFCFVRMQISAWGCAVLNAIE